MTLLETYLQQAVVETDFTAEGLESFTKDFCSRNNIRPRVLYQPLREILGSCIFLRMEEYGREKILEMVKGV